MRKLTLLLLIIFIYSCSDVSELEESVQFYDKEAQEYLLNKLKSENITFRIGSNGDIWYKYRDRHSVEKIKQDVLNYYYPGRGVSYAKQEFNELLKTELNKAEIQYRTVITSGREKIIWEEADGKRVMKLKEKVSQIANQEMMEEFEASQRSKVK